MKKKEQRRIGKILAEGFPVNAHNSLNEAQAEAVGKALTYPISFIQGPPGTGKTEVILRIAALEAARGGKVAIASTNSAAVGNVEQKLERALELAREAGDGNMQAAQSDLAYLAATKLAKLGPADKRANAVGPVHGEALRFEKGVHTFSDGATLTGWEQNKRFDEFTADYPIVTSTVHSLKKCFADGDEAKYDLLIVDEASQMNLVVGIVALSCAKRAVFVGDTEQLPPVAVSEQMEELSSFAKKRKLLGKDAESPYDMSRDGWSFLSSCYEVFVQGNPELFTMLTEHYRCHPAIIGFSNREIYGRKLVIHPPDWAEGHPFPISVRWYTGDYRERTLADGAAPPEEQPDKRQRATCVNEKQLTIMREEELPRIARLIRKGKSICVLSPFRGQIYRLRDMLAAGLRGVAREDGVQVETLDDAGEGANCGSPSGLAAAPVALTIHKSQGQEFDVVYLLPVEDGNWEWPWSQGRRLVNVAVTRAKCELRIVLSTKLMSNGMQKRLTGKVAYVTKPARDEDDPGRQEMYVRKLVDYAWEMSRGVGGLDDAYRPGWGFHKSSVVSVFDGIPYEQSPKKRGEEFATENLVGYALANMGIAGVGVLSNVRFDALAFADGAALNVSCESRYENPGEAHFDFVVYDEETMRVIAAIEVDGQQHRFRSPKKGGLAKQAEMDRLKDEVASALCGATPALLAWTPRRRCVTKQWSPAERGREEQGNDGRKEGKPDVRWVCYPSLLPQDCSFVFLRIPTDGSTYCEFDALKLDARKLPLKKADGSKHGLPPTVDEYVRQQMRIAANQGDDLPPGALFVNM